MEGKKSYFFNLFVIVVLLSTLLSGCSKEEPDPAEAVYGRYEGTVTYYGIGSKPCITDIIMENSTQVSVTVIIDNYGINIGKAGVSSIGENRFSISLTSERFSGTVENKTLKWSMTYYTDVLSFEGIWVEME